MLIIARTLSRTTGVPDGFGFNGSEAAPSGDRVERRSTASVRRWA